MTSAAVELLCGKCILWQTGRQSVGVCGKCGMASLSRLPDMPYATLDKLQDQPSAQLDVMHVAPVGGWFRLNQVEGAVAATTQYMVVLFNEVLCR
jgi:hypothetical protein